MANPGGRLTVRDNQFAVQVQGVRQLATALYHSDAKLSAELRAINRESANRLAKSAQASARAYGGVAAKTAQSIRANASGSTSGITYGGSRYPYAFGAEFGSKRYHQFKPWRGNATESTWMNANGPGYFIYPSVRQQWHTIDEYLRQSLGEFLTKIEG